MEAHFCQENKNIQQLSGKKKEEGKKKRKKHYKAFYQLLSNWSIKAGIDKQIITLIHQ